MLAAEIVNEGVLNNQLSSDLLFTTKFAAWKTVLCALVALLIIRLLFLLVLFLVDGNVVVIFTLVTHPSLVKNLQTLLYKQTISRIKHTKIKYVTWGFGVLGFLGFWFEV